MSNPERAFSTWKTKLVQIKRQKEWIKALESLGYIVESGKGSHYVARNRNFDRSDYRSLVLTIQKDIRKDVNESMFKELIKKGLSENDILKAFRFK